MTEIFYFLGHEQFQPEVLVHHAQLAEEVGFDGVFVSEHFNPWVADVGAGGFAPSTLGAIAVTTKKIKLMTGVITPLYRYHPAVIAQASATIDRLSNGRFLLGVGTGESINEVPLGYEYPSYKERSERMKEALEVMHQLFKGKSVTFSGNYYQTKEAKLYSPAIRQIPIFLAAGGPKSATLAGEDADGVIVSVKESQEAMEKVVDPAKKSAQAKNKNNFSIVASQWSVYAQNNDEAFQALQAWRGLRAPNRDIATNPRDLQQKADTLPKEEILSRYSIVSSADEYINIYEPLVSQLRADIVVIQTTGIDQGNLIQFLGKEVVTKLKR